LWFSLPTPQPQGGGRPKGWDSRRGQKGGDQRGVRTGRERQEPGHVYDGRVINSENFRSNMNYKPQKAPTGGEDSSTKSHGKRKKKVHKPEKNGHGILGGRWIWETFGGIEVTKDRSKQKQTRKVQLFFWERKSQNKKRQTRAKQKSKLPQHAKSQENGKKRDGWNRRTLIRRT